MFITIFYCTPILGIDIFMDNMTDLLTNYSPRVYCINGDCTVRYYSKDGGLALGIVRTNRTHKMGRFPQDIITINSMDLNNLIENIMCSYSIPTDKGDELVHSIKTRSIELVASHLHDHSAHTE